MPAVVRRVRWVEHLALPLGAVVVAGLSGMVIALLIYGGAAGGDLRRQLAGPMRGPHPFAESSVSARVQESAAASSPAPAAELLSAPPSPGHRGAARAGAVSGSEGGVRNEATNDGDRGSDGHVPPSEAAPEPPAGEAPSDPAAEPGAGEPTPDGPAGPTPFVPLDALESTLELLDANPAMPDVDELLDAVAGEGADPWAIGP
jgi:hypothetical protein